MPDPAMCVEYVLSRANILRLEQVRRGHRCTEAAESDGIDPYGAVSQGQVPCWKDPDLPEDQWCEECQASQRIHERLLRERVKARNLWRRLSYRIRKQRAESQEAPRG